MIRILYDHQIFDLQNIGGISRYFCEVYPHISSEVTTKLGVMVTNNEYLKSYIRNNELLIRHDYSRFIPKFSFPGKRKLWQLRNKLKGIEIIQNRDYSIKLLTEGHYDVFHPTFYDSYFFEHCTKPYVITVHDLIKEKFPEFFDLSDIETINKREILHRATKIIAISQNTKQDLIDAYQIPENKIKVIYHGNSLLSSEMIKKDDSGLYFLFTGSRTGYKNFYFFVRSITPLLNEYPKIKIVCTGGSFTKKELDFFNLLNISDQIVHNFCSDSELATLYANAIAFIFPSYYEGFGLPILEAFSLSCPVLLSDIPCFREIAGDAGLYFDPKNMNQIYNACKEILLNEELRSLLVKKGIETSKRFSWKETAKSMVELYSEIV